MLLIIKAGLDIPTPTYTSPTNFYAYYIKLTI